MNLSGRGARILTDAPLPTDSAIRLDWEDSLALGEVRYCLKEGSRFIIGLEVQHSLSDLSGLAILADRLRMESRASIPSDRS